MDNKIGKATIDKNYYIRIADETVYKFFGETSFYPIINNIHEDDLQKFYDSISLCKQGHENYVIVRMKSNNNYTSVVVILKRENKNQDFINLEIHDIVFIAKNNSILSSNEKKYKTILSMFEDTIFEYDVETTMFKVYCIKGESEVIIYNDIFDRWKNEMIEKRYIDILSNTVFEKLCNDIASGVSNFFYQVRNSIVSKGEHMELTHIKGMAIEDNMKLKVVVGTISVVNSFVNKDIEFLTHKSNLDTLTGLLNKRAITEYAIERINDNNDVTLVILDIDYFKTINDNYGHMFGDEVLITISTILKSIVGDRGVVGRIGGDEFFIILENVPNEASLRLTLKSIRSHIEWAYTGKIDDFRLTTSVGAANFPKDAGTYDELFKLADKSLYIAKEKGRDRFIIYDVKKHGPLEVNINDKNKIFINKNRPHISRHANICNIIDELCLKGMEGINPSLESISSLYDIPKINIFYKINNEFEVLLSYGDHINDNDIEICSIFNEYIDEFNDDGMISFGNYMSAVGKSKSLHDYMIKQKSYSVLQYLIYNNDEIKGLILFSTYEKFRKWSEFDMDYLSIVCKLISKIIIREKG